MEGSERSALIPPIRGRVCPTRKGGAFFPPWPRHLLAAMYNIRKFFFALVLAVWLWWQVKWKRYQR